jgi:hypothetical protein
MPLRAGAAQEKSAATVAGWYSLIDVSMLDARRLPQD